jgi:hypothetical protein
VVLHKTPKNEEVKKFTMKKEMEKGEAAQTKKTKRKR